MSDPSSNVSGDGENNSSSYRVASFLYSPVSDDNGADAAATIRKNFASLSVLTKEAAEKRAQIAVFPESPTGTLIWPGMDRERLAEYAEVYPLAGTELCGGDGDEDEDEDGMMFQLRASACLAKNNTLYLIANIPEMMDCSGEYGGGGRRIEAAAQPTSVHPPPEATCDDAETEDRIHIFNSLAVFDPSGRLVVKYRKTNTFTDLYDPAFPRSEKEKVDLRTFLTSFGVEFAVLICADAFNPHVVPTYVEAGVRNFLLPFYDGGRPPIYSITSIHSGLSFAYDANVVGSQSQTYSGVGVYRAGGIEEHWDINMDPSSPASRLIVVDLPKNPAGVDRSGFVPLQDNTGESDNGYIVETCRWLGNEGTEVSCPCIRIDVDPGAGRNFTGSLSQEVPPPDGSSEEGSVLDCSVQATLQHGADVAQTYAMMVGLRPSDKIDYALFCEVAYCPDFPDCSKDCPFCVAPYMGTATLKGFHLRADVPAYFEGGAERQMAFPMMNSFGGRPVSGDKYDWKVIGSEAGDGRSKRYVSLREGEGVPQLMGAGLFYIGFAPETSAASTPVPTVSPTVLPSALPTPALTNAPMSAQVKNTSGCSKTWGHAHSFNLSVLAIISLLFLRRL